MERRIGPLRAEVIEPESQKFTASMVLVHGLWSTASIWRPFMGYLAHRGWRCIALQLHHDPSGEPTDPVAAQVERIRGAVAALEAPPVLVGHDFGALCSLRIAEVSAAVAALAPLIPRPLAAAGSPSLAQAGSWIERRRRRPLRAPRGHWRRSYPPGTYTAGESAALIRALLDQPMELTRIPDHVPSLVMSGDEDPVTPVAHARLLADHVGAELDVQPHSGHALPSDPGWEQRVSALHRWLIQRLGRPLLALYDESWEP